MSGGPALSFAECLVTSQIDSTALTNTVTQTSIIPPASRYALPANFFSQIGKMLRIKARGRLSNTAASVNLSFQFCLGATGTTIVFNSGVFALAAVAKTNVTWAYEAALVCRSLGAAATVLGVGNFECEAAGAGTANVAAGIMLPLTAPVVGATFDSTAVNIMDLMATWGTASATNTITTHQYFVESLN